LIGSLQRQLEVATGRLGASKPDGMARGNTAVKRSVKAKSGATTRGAQKNGARGGARKKSGVVNSAARKSAKKR
jgi:hypothetical protein